MKISELGDITETFGGVETHDLDVGFTPVTIQRLADEEFLLGNGPWGLLRVTPGPVLTYAGASGPSERNLQVKASPVNLGASVDEKDKEHDKIIGIFSWAVTDDGDVLAFADVAHPGGSYSRGLVWFNLLKPQEFKIVKEVDKNSEEAKFYFVLHPSITTIEDKAYFLAMEETPTIYEYDGSELRSLGIPEDFRSRPFVPEKQGAATYPDIFGELEEATSPVAIYGWKGDLWLLGRQPRLEGGTSWTLSRIEPTNPKPEYSSRLLYTLHLPTDTEHLAIATPVESKHWALLEKGSVVERGHQPIKSVVRVPVAWLASWRDSPLRRLDLRACRTAD